MNILFLSKRFYPDVGGVEKHVQEISKILIKEGHSVTVVTQSKGSKSKIDGIDIVRIPMTSKKTSEKIHIWKWFWENRNLIREADIIHAHDVYFWYLPTKLLFLSKKSFVTFHGYETYPIKKKAIIMRKMSEIFADGNIIVGEFIKKWYYTKPDYVIYGATNLPIYKKPDKKLSAVFLGRLDEHTGIMEYAKAVDLIRKKFKNFSFEILGDGPYFKKLKKYNPKGFKNNSQQYLNQNNFAFASRYLSILEALANKRLVFALYDNSVKEDYLKMTPFSKFIIIENDPVEISKKAEYYLKNESQAKELTDKGYDWVKNQSWENIVETYLKLWRMR